MSDESTPTVPPNNELSDSVSAEEQESLNKLRALDPPGSGPVIAIDLDDVLSQTNHAIANCKSSHMSRSSQQPFCQGIIKNMKQP